MKPFAGGDQLVARTARHALGAGLLKSAGCDPEQSRKRAAENGGGVCDRGSPCHVDLGGLRWGYGREIETMATTEQELESFTQFAKARLHDGAPEPSLDELFDLWRIENPSDTDYAENVAAIAGAIDDFRRGDRGQPAGELSRELGVAGP